MEDMKTKLEEEKLEAVAGGAGVKDFKFASSLADQKTLAVTLAAAGAKPSEAIPKTDEPLPEIPETD